MATTGVLNGTSLFLYVNGNAVAHSTSHSLTLSESHRSTSSKDSAGWETILEGMRSWTMTGEGFTALDGAYTTDDLTTLILNRTAVTLRFTTNTTGDKYWTGSARLESLDISSPNEDNVTWSISFKGSGAITNPAMT
jgi:predicted secreted protein